ncbi:hypothetical protein SDRG_01978 [Saprolegnia diclina VS20]|uniref:Uncharacterized protein n=1 Tax=Saprolegnia diclina (strain VS20) TaxID=1156394 RepID=T0S6U5_SAPDV|nr:hypothetical protein SDRG_01978 [Saprolegnia diclina VS20]EQC40913.1 hypothetical protein SDRG_01978 [Saprolegnia diclina VS20]|eukprot:XP_008605757.1 hypothetical protein SDRG_01978 [Saprolegnia diclina VS20]
MDLSSPRIVVGSPALSLAGLFVANASATNPACSLSALATPAFHVHGNDSSPFPTFCGVQRSGNRTQPADWQSLQLRHSTYAVFQSIETDRTSRVFDHHDNNGQRRLGRRPDESDAATWRALAGWSSGGWERFAEAPMFEKHPVNQAPEVWVPVQRQLQ